MRSALGELHHGRRLERISPTTNVAVEDGKYTLRYTFDGKEEERKVRVQQGILLSA